MSLYSQSPTAPGVFASDEPAPPTPPGAGGWPIDPAEAQLAAVMDAIPPGLHPHLSLPMRLRVIISERERAMCEAAALRSELRQMKAQTKSAAALLGGERE